MPKTPRPLLLGLILILSPCAHADYRAHRLSITNAETGQIREVVSTLDHYQYPGYHPLAPGERIQLVTSWRCPGRTSHRPICPSPQDSSLDQGR